MLIGICGGISAGKQSVADYLVHHKGFTRIYLARTSASQLEGSASPTSESDASEQNNLFHDTKAYVFPSVESLLNFITKKWQHRWVTTDIWDEHILESLLHRPSFLLVGVDAPVSVRWKRYKTSCERNDTLPPSLEDFVIRNDDHLFDQKSGLARLIDRAEVRLVNQTTSIDSLHQALGDLDLTNEERLRPNWDQYFMQLASLAAQRSNCMKRRVGCVLVREKRVISTGYNGTPRNLKNCNEGGCTRCNDGNAAGVSLSTCLCLHAEENALLEAGRERIRENSILYCDTCPCLTCSIKITQVGISEVVYSRGYSMDRETAEVLLQGGVQLRQFCPPQKGLVLLE